MNILLELFYVFFKIGIIGFGGGYSMISMIYTESQKVFGMSSAEFAKLIAVDLVVPGPIAINSATYVGYFAQGVSGAIVATMAVCLPSYVVVLTTMFFMDKLKNNKTFERFLKGVKAAAVGLIAAAACLIAKDVLLNEKATLLDFIKNPIFYISPICVIIFIATTIGEIKFNINPILLTVLAGIAGAFFLS